MKYTIQLSVPNDGVECIFIHRDGVEIGCLYGQNEIAKEEADKIIGALNMPKRFTEIDILTPKDGDVVHLNRWWLCREGDPRRALLYDGHSPQCNSVKDIAEMMAYLYNKKWHEEPALSVVFIEVAYVPLPLINEDSIGERYANKDR